MRRLNRKRGLILIAVIVLVVAAAVAAAQIATGGHGTNTPKLTVVGGNPAVGRAFASFMNETNVTCLDTRTKNLSDNNPVFVCTGSLNGKPAPCRPIAWNGHDVHYVDFWNNAFDNGNGAVTC